MGLFGRKKKEDGIIDLGDGNVLVSPEKQEELAEQSIAWITSNYGAPMPQVVSDAISVAVSFGFHPTEARAADPDHVIDDLSELLELAGVAPGG